MMSPAADTHEVGLSPSELRQLEPLRLASRRSFAGRVRGERLSRNKGISIEFADYRDYSDGDDLRHLDWAILARLDRAAIRTYQDEDDLAVYLALDASASMDFGEPSKFQHAARLAAAVGFIGLVGSDAVYPLALGHPAAPGRALRGRASHAALANWVSAWHPTGVNGLAASLTRFAAGSARPGMFFCISDGLDPAAPDALRALAARGHDVVMLQVLSEIELNPDLEGDLRLLDAETGEAVEITAHSQALRQYAENLAAHNQALEAAATRGGGRYLMSIVGEPLGLFMTRGLRRAGIVR
ncbi:MAG TPA: DUF58 domain-containing protein [Armatimonadota bacterium]|jgi:uncharacterized protein (DUF58 family)